MTPAAGASILDLLIGELTERYVFPERARRAAELLSVRNAQGAYDGASGAELCARISQDLFEACADKHLRLIWHEAPIASADEAELVARMREQIRLENHGVRRVEVLPGNVGLVELTIIPEASSGTPALTAAMRLVEHTDALIFDLRETRGGSPDGVVLLTSYLFADGDVHLTDFFEGPCGPPRQFWTYAHLPGPRYLDRAVYVLTSSSTFSGGEAFAYDLQVHARATVVGEVTRGGAHPSMMVPLSDQIELRLPVARPVSAVTGGNWEGVGVIPDVLEVAANALDVALDLHREQRSARSRREEGLADEVVGPGGRQFEAPRSR